MSRCGRARRSIVVDGKNVVPEVHAVLDAMADFSTGCAAAPGKATPQADSQRRQHRHRWLDLGPVMAYERSSTTASAR